MKILLLAPHPFFQNRGTPIAEKALLEVLAARGCHLNVLTYHEGEDIDIPECRIHRIPRLPGLSKVRPGFSAKKVVCDAVMFMKCLGMVRRNRFDLIHAVEESVFIALAMKLLFRVPFVYDMDSSLAQQMMEKYRFLQTVKWALEACEKLAVRRSLGVLAVCKSLQETALKYDPGKIVGLAEDPSLLTTEIEEVERLVETIGCRGPIVMYVGNLEKYQGIDLLMQAFQRALPKVPAAQLVVIGGSERHIRHYELSAGRLGINGNVHFLGPRPVSMLGSYLSQADVLVSPRVKGHNTPMKIYSYLDSGRAVLATRLPTHTQVLDDQIAYLAAAEPAAMGEGLVKLLQDEVRRTDLALRARERVREEFSPEAFRRKALSFYDSVEQKVLGANAGRK